MVISSLNCFYLVNLPPSLSLNHTIPNKQCSFWIKLKNEWALSADSFWIVIQYEQNKKSLLFMNSSLLSLKQYIEMNNGLKFIDAYIWRHLLPGHQVALYQEEPFLFIDKNDYHCSVSLNWSRISFKELKKKK